MRRRAFLACTAACWPLARSIAHPSWRVEAVHATHRPATVSGGIAEQPSGTRAPFDWTVRTIPANDGPPLILHWPDLPENIEPTHLRFAIGLDARDDKAITVTTRDGRHALGTIPVRFASQFQVYELALAASDHARLRREGVALRVTQGSPLAVLVEGAELPDALRPHLLVPGDASPTVEFLRRMDSLACIQPFSWMEGCVLDGLLDLADQAGTPTMRETAKRHLSRFITAGKLVYEGPRSEPSDGRIYGIEGTLPFAALARLQPDHPLLDQAIAFWKSRRSEDGAVIDGDTITSEGAYTVGYPMARIASGRRSEELMSWSLAQLTLRQKAFFDGREFWRTRDKAGKRGNRNWARGIAWQLLGMARTMRVAREMTELGGLVDSFQQLATWIRGSQRPDGLWSVFVDEPELVPDTAGSAGIAAALAIGTSEGWLDTEARSAARTALDGLTAHLTSDGFLGGAAQSNKGGEGLQRGEFRCIYQMGMGLKAQLMASLANP